MIQTVRCQWIDEDGDEYTVIAEVTSSGWATIMGVEDEDCREYPGMVIVAQADEALCFILAETARKEESCQ